MGRRMTNIRQQRSNLAQVLTDKFDQLEDECSIFLNTSSLFISRTVSIL